MAEIALFSAHIPGASHLARALPCQDRALARSFRSPMGHEGSVLAVADGHGSAAHFRSDIGAEFAVQIAAELLSAQIDVLKAMAPGGDFFVKRGRAGDNLPEADRTGTDEYFETAMRELFARINREWCKAVMQHAVENPLPDKSAPVTARVYGCTLMAAACIEGFWCAFQLGDGAILALGVRLERAEPIAGDSRCVENRTTSMCNSSHPDFRYCAGSEVPAMLLLTSDGLVNSYGSPMASIQDFLMPVADEIASSPFEQLEEELRQSLPEISAEGSGDDIGIAFWVYPDRIPQAMDEMLPAALKRRQSRIAEYRAELDGSNIMLAELQADIRAMEREISDMRKQFAERLSDMRARLNGKRSVLRTLERERAEYEQEIAYLEGRLNKEKQNSDEHTES